MLKTIILFTFLIASISSFTQNHPNTVLWEVTKPGLTYKSYLFGTFHEVNPAFFLSLPYAVRKLDNANTLYVERRTIGVSDTTGLYKLQFWNIEEWNKILNDVQQKIFEAFVKKAADSFYYTLPPLVLLRNLAAIYIQNFADTVNRTSVEQLDAYIEKVAFKNKKAILALDEDQIDILVNSTTKDYQFLNSVYVADCIGLMKKMLDDDASYQAVEDYKNLKINYRFETEINKLHLPAPFLLERNNKWMITLDKAFQQNDCFVAVGIGHLFFKEGLIQQLKHLGYTVNPIPAR